MSASQPLQIPTTLVQAGPKPRKGRTLILCFDGTSNRFDTDDKNTNVVLLFSMLEKNKPDQQLVYYQTGIGTYTPSGLISRIGQKVARALDEAFAWYLEDHVIGGYKFLMDTYQEGDKICLFGFSRGAYTARALAAMIHRVGLLPARNVEQVPFAYKIFKDSQKEIAIKMKDPDDRRGKISGGFKNTFSRRVKVEFVGIWDTVASVGFIPRSLPNTSTNLSVKHVRHALALDERRAKFKASYWNPPREAQTTVELPQDDQVFKKNLDDGKQTVEEVWFAGGHGDVGGGWEVWYQEVQLARIPFRWMLREAMECVPDILWHEKTLDRYDVRKPDLNDPVAVQKYVEREQGDAKAKFHSAFKEAKRWYLWQFLEVLPLLKTTPFWGYKIQWFHRPNWWSPRKVRESTADRPQRIQVHSSVWTRIHHHPEGYESAVTLDPSRTDYVDGWALPKTDKDGKPMPPVPGNLVP
ncbi:hypothetical protein FRC01_006588 [Tulasnella sp. 417]|nr:hypothetical protein FRC01_006588 [Tulasnella sp. 417]